MDWRHRLVSAIALGFVFALSVGGPMIGTADPRIVQVAMRCFATGTSRVIGIDRICYYRCSGMTITTIAVPATDLCPDFIDR